MKNLIGVLAVKKIIVLLLVLALVSEQNPTQAQALPAVTRVAVAMGGVVERFMLRTGIAANDSRFSATLGALGSAANDAVFGAASTVGMVAAGIAGAPVWATVAVGLGVGALAFGAYKLLTANSSSGIGVALPGTDPALKTNKPVSPESGKDVICLPGQAACTPFNVPFPSDVQYRYRISGGAGAVVAIRNYGDLNNAVLNNSAWLSSGSGGPSTLSITGNTKTDTYMMANYRLSYSSGATVDKSEIATANPSFVATPWQPETVTAPFDQVLSQIPSSALTQPISNQTLADLTNAALQRAASKADYKGAPVSLTNPVTAKDVADWLAANPSAMPTGADLLSPLPNGTVSMPPASSNPGTTTPTTNVTIDLGPDPGIGAPTLEPTPTAQSILQPLLNLMPDLKRYAVPSHSSACPRPEINLPLFERTFKIEAHCEIAESMRTSIYSMMVAFWTISSLFIVLAA
ncbi:hypothetical protein [Herbaspirillum sp. NPDC101397]|uniref:hypothetical protein n=1 Tax=Herbaspirillum sp. NPDC101397 TaxID=3364006 RepID=UPI00383AEA2D